jgi:hypothetical protein
LKPKFTVMTKSTTIPVVIAGLLKTFAATMSMMSPITSIPTTSTGGRAAMSEKHGAGGKTGT